MASYGTMRGSPTLVALALLVACDGGPERATLEGDISVSRDGTVLRAAGSPVLLIGDADSVLAALRRGCQTYALELQRLREAARRAQRKSDQMLASGRQVRALEAGDTARAYTDSARSLERGYPAVLDSLERYVARRARSDTNARYRFDTLSPGRYLVFGTEAMGDDVLRWLDTVTTSAGATIRRDLSEAYPAGELCDAALLR